MFQWHDSDLRILLILGAIALFGMIVWLIKNKKIEVKVSLLTQYLESGQWLRDYELDEKGKLPCDLKRGILSEDGLYNLIADIEQAKRKKSGFIGKIRNIFGL